MMNIEEMSAAYYEIQAQYRRSLQLDDPPPWSSLTRAERLKFIDDTRFALMNANKGPDKVHEVWVKQKREEGYVFGVPSTPSDRRSPDLRPYHRLSKNRRMRDAVLFGTVRALAKIEHRPRD